MEDEDLVDAIDIGEKTLLGDLMKTVVEQIKALPKAWDAISEADQEAYLDRIQLQCAEAARQAVQIIASRSFINVPAVVESVTFKDGAKAVLKPLELNQDTFTLAEAAGSVVSIIIPDTEDLLESEEGKPQAEPDQRGMDLGHEYADDQAA